MGEPAETLRKAFDKAVAAGRDSVVRLESPTTIEQIKLRGENFAGANWSNLSFKQCDFSGAKLEGARLDGATFDACSFAGANLDGASLASTHFLNACNFENASLKKAQAELAEFLSARLGHADALGGIFFDADFDGADLAQTHLEGADLRGAKNLRLNRTYARGAQFSNDAADSWSFLRRTYTGPRFLLSLLFPAIFILSVAAKSYGLWTIALLQRAVTPSQGDPCLSVGATCEEVAIWEIVTGWHAGIGAGAFATASLLYNFLRLLMTLAVARMRDDEERNGWTPRLKTKVSVLPKVEPGHAHLAQAHLYFLRWFQWVTFLLSVWGWWELLGTTLLVPV